VTERSTLRLHPPVIFWWVWVAFAAANVADYAAQGLPSARFGSLLAAILLLGTGLAYTLALRPKVIEDGDGLTVVNPFRVHHLPWPVIDSVDTGEWVRVRFAGRAVNCWALYVSTRARRKLAVGASAGTAGVPRRLRGLVAAAPTGYAQPPSRLPDEALRLASLPVGAAMAARLDSRAERERKRAEANASAAAHASAAANASAATSVAGGASASAGASVATTTWSWPALAVVVVPALILLAVALS
jgi:Bacterial PH domain